MSIASISVYSFTGPRNDSARDSWPRTRSCEDMTHQEAVDTLATERYLLDEMAAEDRQIFEQHYFECEICADDLRVATAMLQGAKEGLAGTASASQVIPMAAHRRADRQPAWYRSAVIPWAAAATLAALAGYESLWVVPSLRPGASPL